MQSTLKLPTLSDIRVGAAIVNANGIPGTLGCLALAREDNQLVFLTSYHVLFGAGTGEQDAVWVAADDNRRSLQRVASVRHGRCGTIIHGSIDVFIDCAIAELDKRIVRQECPIAPEVRVSLPTPGDRVSKVGAGTGRTEGIVIDTNYSDTVRVAGHRRATSGQILVRPIVPGGIFSAGGDSGAILRRADDTVIGLLWGVDARGFGLACPIVPVLQILHLHLVHFPQEETS